MSNRSIFFRPQVTPFVTLFVERAGSTFMATLLNTHPDILSLREKFAELRQESKNGGEQLKWAKDFLTAPLIGRKKARGFKTKLVDILEPDSFANLLVHLNCKIIQLQRHNSVKAVVSTINARRLYEASGTWNLLDEKKRLSAFTVDPDEFANLLEQRETWDRELEAYVQRLQLPTLVLHYEDLLKDEDTFIKRIFDFLEVKPKPVEKMTKKNTKDDLREVVLNFDELHARYAGTKYESMFDEVIAS